MPPWPTHFLSYQEPNFHSATVYCLYRRLPRGPTLLTDLQPTSTTFRKDALFPWFAARSQTCYGLRK
jgi:hypothetical protein